MATSAHGDLVLTSFYLPGGLEKEVYCSPFLSALTVSKMERADRTRRSVNRNVLNCLLLFSCFCFFNPVALVICSLPFDGRLFRWNDNSTVLLFPVSTGNTIHGPLGPTEYLISCGNGRRTSSCGHREDHEILGLLTILVFDLHSLPTHTLSFIPIRFRSPSLEQPAWILPLSHTVPIRKPTSHTTPMRKPTT